MLWLAPGAGAELKQPSALPSWPRQQPFGRYSTGTIWLPPSCLSLPATPGGPCDELPWKTLGQPSCLNNVLTKRRGSLRKWSRWLKPAPADAGIVREAPSGLEKQHPGGRRPGCWDGTGCCPSAMAQEQHGTITPRMPWTWGPTAASWLRCPSSPTAMPVKRLQKWTAKLPDPLARRIHEAFLDASSREMSSQLPSCRSPLPNTAWLGRKDLSNISPHFSPVGIWSRYQKPASPRRPSRTKYGARSTNTRSTAQCPSSELTTAMQRPRLHTHTTQRPHAPLFRLLPHGGLSHDVSTPPHTVPSLFSSSPPLPGRYLESQVRRGSRSSGAG